MRHQLALLFAVVTTGCAGQDGTSYLTDLHDEAPGANCPTGGVRISTGADDNGNGSLDSSEVADTKYVCGNSQVTDVNPEPPGANCPGGGVKVQVGVDTNHNGMLDGSEATSTDYVCGSGTAVVTKTFMRTGVAANTGTPITIVAGTIQATGPGKVIALASSDLFCTSTECPTQPAPAPSASAYFWIADAADTVAPTADYDFTYVEPNVTQTVSRTSFFPVTAAGALMYNVRGQDVVGDLTYYRSGLTLIFLP